METFNPQPIAAQYAERMEALTPVIMELEEYISAKEHIATTQANVLQMENRMMNVHPAIQQETKVLLSRYGAIIEKFERQYSSHKSLDEYKSELHSLKAEAMNILSLQNQFEGNSKDIRQN